jgi:hypothetical protein
MGGVLVRLLIATVLAVFALAGSADAAQRLSRQDQQILSQLSPQARNEVLSRLTPGETVKEIIETMALNRLSQLYAEGKVVDLDVIQGIATIEYKDGTRKQVPFKIEELVIRE